MRLWVLTWSTRTSVVDPGLCTLSTDTIVVHKSWDVRTNATSSALPSSGIDLLLFAPEPMSKLNSAGSPSHATSILVVYCLSVIEAKSPLRNAYLFVAAGNIPDSGDCNFKTCIIPK